MRLFRTKPKPEAVMPPEGSRVEGPLEHGLNHYDRTVPRATPCWCGVGGNHVIVADKDHNFGTCDWHHSGSGPCPKPRVDGSTLCAR